MTYYIYILNNKLMIKLIQIFGVQIWDYAKPSQIKTLQACQSVPLHLINAMLGFVTNHSLNKHQKAEIADNIATNYRKNVLHVFE